MRQADNRDLLRLAALCAAVAIGCAVLLAVSGCQSRAPQITTGEVIQNPAEASFDRVGDVGYAVVRAAALPYLQDRFESALFEASGLTKWNARMDCNGHAVMWQGVARAVLAAQLWHSSSSAQAPAVAEIWYRTRTGDNHAILQIRTESGTVYWDPQPPGRQVDLTPQEVASIFLRKW